MRCEHRVPEPVRGSQFSFGNRPCKRSAVVAAPTIDGSWVRVCRQHLRARLAAARKLLTELDKLQLQVARR